MVQKIPSTEKKAACELAHFRQLKAEKRLTVEGTDRLSVEAAASLLDHYLSTGRYLEDAVTLLCEVATLRDENLAKPGLKGIFPLLVERLSDSFNPDCCSLYDRAFVQVVEFCRRLPAGSPLDAQLRRFGLISGQGLLERKQRIKDQREEFDASRKGLVKKVFVLSRVTLGADVAITSVVMEKMKRVFPRAELVLLGSLRLRQLFGDDARVRVREVSYERSGGLIERLGSWLELAETLEQELAGLHAEEYVIVDPDSRLTQLGLLPLTADDSRYYFFESRGYRKAGLGCIGQLALAWVNERFGDDDALYPYVSLLEKDRAFAKRFCRELRVRGATYLVSLNFGVGGNLRKRVSDPFEERLVSRLLDDGSTVILDKGAGEEEISRANRLIGNLSKKEKVVIELREGDGFHTPMAKPILPDVVVWEGSIGLFSALIGETNEYIGYDSAGQHIAAALGVPTIDIFADTSHPLFFERWRPFGKENVEVVKADATDSDDQTAFHRIVGDVMTCHEKLKSRCIAPGVGFNFETCDEIPGGPVPGQISKMAQGPGL